MSLNPENKLYKPSNRLGALIDKLSTCVQNDDFSNALKIAKKGLSVSKKEFGALHPVTANLVRKVAIVHRALNNTPEARLLFEQSLDIYQKTLGVGHPMIGTLYRDISIGLFNEGHVKECIRSLNMALKIYKESLGANHQFTIGVRNDLDMIFNSDDSEDASEESQLALENYNDANRHLRAGDYDLASEKIKSSLKLNINRHGKYHANVALCYKMLGEIVEYTEGVETSIRYLKKSANISKKYLEHNPESHIGVLSIIGNQYRKCGEYDNALDFQKQARSLLIRYDVQSDLNSIILLNLAGLFREQGEYESAINYAQEAKKHLEILNIEDRNTAVIFSLLGTLYSEIDSYNLAEEYYIKALDLKKEIYGSEHLEYAYTLANLGTLYASINYLEKCFQYCSQAQEIASQFLDENHPWMLRINDQLNRIQVSEKGQLETSSVLDKLSSLKQNYGEKSGVYIEAMMNEAEKAKKRDDKKNCLHLSSQAVQLYETHSLPPTHHFLKAFNMMAYCQYEEERYDEAEINFKRLYSILKENKIETSKHNINALKGLIRLNLIKEVPGEITPLFKELIAYEDSSLLNFISATSEEQRIGIEMQVADTLDLLISSVFKGAITDTLFCYELVLKRKGFLVEVTLKNFDSEEVNKNPELKEPIDELQTLNRALSEMIVNPRFRRGIDYFYEDYNRKTSRKIELERNISKKIPFRNLDLSDGSRILNEVISHFSAGKVLIDYVKFKLPIGELNIEHYACFVLGNSTEESSIEFHYLGESKEIEEQVDQLRAEVTTIPDSKDPFTSALIEKKVGASLVSKLMGFLSFQNVQNGLTLVPVGQLWKLPYDTLFIDNSRRLIDVVAVSYLSNPRDILQFKSFKNTDLTKSVALSNPNFNLSDKESYQEQEKEQMQSDMKYFEEKNVEPPVGWGVKFSSDEKHFEENEPYIWNEEMEKTPNISYFTPLEGTFEEGEEIAALLNCYHVHDDEATLEYFVKLNSPPILHVASHGFFYSKEQWDEVLGERQLFAKQLNGIEGISFSNFAMSSLFGSENVEELIESSSYEIDSKNMLHYSGIALSGINTWLKNTYVRREAGIGFINAEYIANMNFGDTQMAVLSACETGLGTIDDLEGVIGFRRAFSIAGCQSLVTTLWKIPDQKTKEFMVYFYHNLLKGLSKDKALREAKLTFKEMKLNPYYWGAFVVEGNLSPLNS